MHEPAPKTELPDTVYEEIAAVLAEEAERLSADHLHDLLACPGTQPISEGEKHDR